MPSPEFHSLIDSLNPAQREAVLAPPEPRLVLAGAGSGKTRVLTHRVAYLIAAEGVSPQSMLAVTFTNKAAAEMRGRIERLLQLPVRALWVGTFHGIAHRLLRLHFREAGLPQNFQILDSDDQSRMVKRILRGLDMPEDRWPPRAVCAFINSQKEEGIRVAQLQDSGDYNQRQYVRVYTAYQSQCDGGGLVDFAELLLRAHELCRDHPAIQAHYRQRFRHILVDEFQDTNTLQYAWLRVLAGDQGVLFAVGDDDQSIYSFRGARVENMQRLSRDFPAIEVVRLEQNYRSTATILKAANSLIARNTGRLGKNLWTDGAVGEPLQLYAAFTETDEAEHVVARMQDHLRDGFTHSALAILYRSNAQSRVLEEALIRHRIPYRIYGGLRFFDRMEIRDALAYLRLVANGDDDAAFERAVNTPPRGIGATTVDRLRAHAREHSVSLWSAAQALAVASTRSRGAVGAFVALIEQMRRETLDLRLSDRVERIIERSGLLAHYEKEKGEQGEARLENLAELVTAARAFEPPQEAEGGDPLAEFLAHAALEAGEKQSGPGEDCVQMMTLHAAKGLEFPVVFLVGLENGLFPHQRALDEGGLEEERRLCYVGITRAQRRLHLSYAETRRMHGLEQPTMPSMFLRELPADCIVETRPRAHVLRPAFSGPRPSRSPFAAPRPEPLPSGFSLGARVRHPSFGEGTILGFEGDGERMAVEVKFAKVGTKRLILSMARLELIGR